MRKAKITSDENNAGNQLLSHAIDFTREAILIVDAEQMNVIEVNFSACHMLGFTRAELISKPLASIECSIADLFFWDDLRSEQDLLEQTLQQRIAETEWMRSDSSSLFVEKRVSFLSDQGQHFWIIHAEDITVRRQIEEEQGHLVAQLRSSLEATAEGILAVDLNRDIIYLNRRFAQMWGLSDDLLLDNNASEIIAYIKTCLINVAEFELSLQEMQAEPHLETEELLLVKDGRYFVCVSKPEFLRDSLVGRVFSVRDITAMKLVENDLLAARDLAERASGEKSRMLEALSVSESRLRRLANSSLIGIMQGELSGLLSDANDVLLKILGVPRDNFDTANLNWLALTSDASHQAYHNAISELLHSGQALPFDVELIRADGVLVPATVGLSILEGSTNEWVGFVLDLTEQRKADRIKSDFISAVSHELRTPLTSISGSLGLLVGGVGGELAPRIVNLLKVAHKNSLRLTVLVNDLLDMEQLSAGKMSINLEPADLLELTRQAIEANTAYAQTFKVQLKFTQYPAQARAILDSGRTMQVFANLLSNAIKFSPSGSTVEVRILQQEDSFRIEVQDSGQGIPFAFRERIFQKFAQADDGDTRQQGGTGLGLNISKTLVEKMQGSIGFESEEGQGAVFWFTLRAAT